MLLDVFGSQGPQTVARANASFFMAQPFGCKLCTSGKYVLQEFPYSVIIKGAPEKILHVCNSHLDFDAQLRILASLEARESSLHDIPSCRSKEN